MADNLFQILQDAWNAASTSGAKVFGVEVALVTNVKDPEQLGRVKICFPRFPGKPESDWARVAQPAAGPGRGFYWLPEVNDEVLVAFERGEAHKPYVVGAVWNGKDAPMKDAYADENHIRMIQTKSGHQIVLSDKDGEELITIGDKSGKRTITFDVKNKKLLFEAGIGDVELKAEKKIILECEDLEIKTKKTGKLDIGDTFDLVIKDKAGLKAGPEWTWKAQKIEINPSGGAGFGGLAAMAWRAAKAAAAAAIAAAEAGESPSQVAAAAGGAAAGSVASDLGDPEGGDLSSDVAGAGATAPDAGGEAGRPGEGTTRDLGGGGTGAAPEGASGGTSGAGSGAAPEGASEGATGQRNQSGTNTRSDFLVSFKLVDQDSGAALAGVRCLVTGPDGSQTGDVTTDAEGFATCPVPAAGSYSLAVLSKDSQSGQTAGPSSAPDTNGSGTNTSGTDTKSGFVVSFKLVDPDSGAALAGVRCLVTGPDGSQTGDVTTDAEGVATCPVPAAGSYSLAVLSKDSQSGQTAGPSSGPDTNGSGINTSGTDTKGDFVVSFKLVDPDSGAALAGVRCLVTGPDGSQTGDVTTDAEGVATCPVPAAGSYSLAVLSTTDSASGS